jgi:pantoate--beta-alanine ligase
MKLSSTVADLHNKISECQLNPLGFVPTMGALHEGHLSLVENAVKKCRLVIVSIFVNPTQFNDKNDLSNYPRTLDEDLEMLGKGLRVNDIVFTPSVKEIYPSVDKRIFNFGNLDNVMEALHRPGHFNGVAQVVSRLFQIVDPDFAYFGQKDFQQLAVVKELVRQTGLKVKIIGNPIIRENDGLAMSSRNRLLKPEIRKNASVIFRTISMVSEKLKEHEISEIKKWVEDAINSVPGFRVEYFEIADDAELIPLSWKSGISSKRKYFACIAVKAGDIRLIDNIEIALV